MLVSVVLEVSDENLVQTSHLMYVVGRNSAKYERREFLVDELRVVVGTR